MFATASRELTEPTDEALVLACRRGDTSAWEQLILRYQRLIYSIPRRAGLSEDLAAEVFQNVFAKLLEKIDQLEQPDRVKAWLVTSARRETWAFSRRERTSHISIEDSDETVETLLDQAMTPDEEVLRIEEQHQVYMAVMGLGDRCRILLSLLFYEVDPPSYAEIARRLDMAESSIGAIRGRCLQKLRQRLVGKGIG